ncbi:metallophosphoesterase [Candidatus Woesearchaeota archaeon]|nr:MAG: metallophosphoesterase [Candidatus Woesearchaeota archaeon]
MELLKGITAIDLAITIDDMLIIGDLHMGYEDYVAQTGVLLPKFHYKELQEKIEAILKKTKPKLIVINGDVKHEFGSISNEEWRNILKLIDYLSKTAKVVFIKGNHDAILMPIIRKRKLAMVDYYIHKQVYITHGHKIPKDKEFQKAKTIIIGHEHPAISLNDGVRTEKFKCFLVGKFHRKNLIVMPSMNLVTEGTDILKEKLLSPFLKNVDNFQVFIVGDKVYKFGKVKEYY